MGLFTGGNIRQANDPRHFWRSLFGADNTAGFSPSGQPGLVAHYDASVASSITIATGVRQWNDLTGLGHNLLQATGGLQPTISGNGVLFGSGMFMQTATFTLGQPWTIYLVMMQTTWGNGRSFFDGFTNNTSQIQQRGVTPQLQLFGGTSFVATNAGLALNTNAVVSGVFSGAASSLRVNKTAATTGNGGSTSVAGFTLGSLANGTFGANSLVFEVLIFNVAHSTAQQNQIILALGNKWGIAV